ncbi:MAG: DUF1015 domain-containing protein [Phycisphaerales bacterium]|nr:DUF1015 domain-containing protein [Phycisphaerales bacterium]
MAHIEPFQAIRYGTNDVSCLVAPPYDVLSAANKKALLEKDDHNIVAIDLPHMPPKKAGPDSVYAEAAGQLTCWLDIRALIHDEQPSLYAYHQTYKLGKQTLTRKMFFARLRLEPFGTGSIFPHEQTFGGPKEDRLKLTAATRCHLSPIFGLYPDPENEVSSLIDEAIQYDPDQWGMLDGVENKLWVIDDLPTIKSIQVRLSDKPVFIADGHHRYGTALMYKEMQSDELGKVAPNDAINHVLAVLGGMEDPGATIQPYFRTITGLSGLTANDLQGALGESFNWTPAVMPSNAEMLAELLAETGPQSMALYIAKDDACVTITPKEQDMLSACEPERKPEWRQLAYTILHRHVIQAVIGPQFNDGKEPTIHYHKSMKDAIQDARKTAGVAALMPAVTMGQLRDICTAGELMPQKSTYFFPKLATGMVINPLY